MFLLAFSLACRLMYLLSYFCTCWLSNLSELACLLTYLLTVANLLLPGIHMYWLGGLLINLLTRFWFVSAGWLADVLASFAFFLTPCLHSRHLHPCMKLYQTVLACLDISSTLPGASSSTAEWGQRSALAVRLCSLGTVLEWKLLKYGWNMLIQ